MDDDTMHTLIASTNRGRYALDDPAGHDITSGDRMAIWLGGQWIEGSVEHAGSRYANESSGRAERGLLWYRWRFSSWSGACAAPETGFRPSCRLYTRPSLA